MNEWRVSLIAVVLLASPSRAWSQEAVDVASVIQEPYLSEANQRWGDDIRKLEQLDKTESHGPDEILMIGSSSIRRWDNVEVDMAPYRIIRRGYGGAKYSDVAVFAQRLIHPHPYRALVLFVGNDIAGTPEDHTVEQVDAWVRHIIGVSRRHQPDAPVLLIEVTPTIKRWEQYPKIRVLNAQLREIALSTSMVFFVSTAGHMLDPVGQPRADLFDTDDLHLNDKGYCVWSEQIRDRLNDVFRMIAQYPRP